MENGWSSPATRAPSKIELPVIDPWFSEHDKPVGIVIKGAVDLVPETALRSIVIAAGPDGITPRDALAEMARRGFVYKTKGKRIYALRKRAGIATGLGRNSRWTVT